MTIVQEAITAVRIVIGFTLSIYAAFYLGYGGEERQIGNRASLFAIAAALWLFL